METTRPPRQGGWIDKIEVRDGEQIKLRRLREIGGSLAIILPKVWVEWACKKDEEGNFWVEISDLSTSQMTIKGYKE